MGTLLKNDLDINCISVLVLVLKHLEFTFSTEDITLELRLSFQEAERISEGHWTNSSGFTLDLYVRIILRDDRLTCRFSQNSVFG